MSVCISSCWCLLLQIWGIWSKSKSQKSFVLLPLSYWSSWLVCLLLYQALWDEQITTKPSLLMFMCNIPIFIYHFTVRSKIPEEPVFVISTSRGVIFFSTCEIWIAGKRELPYIVLTLNIVWFLYLFLNVYSESPNGLGTRFLSRDYRLMLATSFENKF